MLTKGHKAGVVYLLVVLLMVVLVAVGIYVLKPKQSVQPVENEGAFDSYVYTEHHSDNSEMQVVIAKVDDTYSVLTKYFDATGAASFHVELLSKDNAERFTKDLQDFQLASEEVLDESVYTKGVLTYVSSNGSMMYNVDPLDISGFVSVDPWSDGVDTLVSKPNCADVFDMDSLESALQPASKTELYAFTKLVYDQIVDVVGVDKLEHVSVGAAMVDGMYPLSIQTLGEKDDVQLSMSEYGYVKNMK